MVCLWKKILCAVFVLCSLFLLGTAVAAAADRPVHTAGPIEPLGSMYDHNTAEEASAEPLGSGPSSGNANEETSVGPIPLGLGKGENMVAVIDQVFGKDLTGYGYVSFAELWANETLPSPLQPIFNILIDMYTDLEVGDRAPLGFLYQRNDVYTVVEQPNGDLQLSVYEVLPADGPDVPPDHHLVETVRRPATRQVVQSLYE